jgi:flagellar biosynthesis component FlhA
MPNTLFLLGSALTFMVWWIIRKNNENFDNNDTNVFENNKDIKNNENEEDENIISLSEIADNSSISMQLG